MLIYFRACALVQGGLLRYLSEDVYMDSKINSRMLEKKMKEESIVLLVLSKEGYSEKIAALAKIAAKQSRCICYVSVNKPADALAKMFVMQGIDAGKFRFIDCISRTAFDNSVKKGNDRTIFISSPGNLTELSINVASAISEGASDVFVDALSTFLIYDEPLAVVKFAHNLITKLRECNGRGFFVVLKNEVSNALLDDLSMFSDSVVEV